MIALKHTPGPWELSNGARVYAPGKAGPLLATIAYLPKAPGQELANARLMTTAPELLQALDDLVGAVLKFTNVTETDWPELQAARAAIAKAQAK